MNMTAMAQIMNLRLLLLVSILTFSVSPIWGKSPSCVSQRQSCIEFCTGAAKFECEESSSSTTQAKASACVCTELSDSLSTLVDATTCLLLEKRCKLSCPSGSTPDFQCSANGQNVSQVCICTDAATGERQEGLFAGEQDEDEEEDGGETRRPTIIGGLIQDDGTQSLFVTGDSSEINPDLRTSRAEMVTSNRLLYVLIGALLLSA